MPAKELSKIDFVKNERLKKKNRGEKRLNDNNRLRNNILPS